MGIIRRFDAGPWTLIFNADGARRWGLSAKLERYPGQGWCFSWAWFELARIK